MASILPSSDEWASLTPGEGSACRELCGDARLMLAAGYALLLQVCHPVVGAGVSEHSRFREDAWGRLLRTLDYCCTMVYADVREAGEMGARVRAMHRRIRGVAPGIGRYSALEPEAYAWVHATLAEAVVTGHERFGRVPAADERERFWTEWRALGRLLGVRERDLPRDWPRYRDYFETMVERRLKRTTAAEEVLSALRRPPPPALLGPLRAGWPAAQLPLGGVLALVTVGLLPRGLAQRLGVHLDARERLALGVFAATARACTPLMPQSLRNVGPAYLERRERSPARLR